METPPPCLVWLAAYPHGARRLGKRRSAVTLPQLGCFEAMLKAHKVECGFGYLGRCLTNALDIRGLARLAPRETYTPLWRAGRQAQLLWTYYGKPLDSAVVEVKEAFVMIETRRIHTVLKESRTGGHSVGTGVSTGARVGSRGICRSAEDLTVGMHASRVGSDGSTTAVENILAAMGIEPCRFGQVPLLLLLPRPTC